jgi:AcrR family transcriptional regulator
MKVVKRKYQSGHRKILAGQTRAQVLQAARTLFGEQGYARTTIEDIAQHAGVSVPTVYSIYGSKRAILLKLLDEIEQAADPAPLIQAFQERTGDEHAQLSLFLDFSVRLFTRGLDLIRIAELAGAADPDIRALWELGEARRLDSCRKLVRGWEKRRVFRRGLSEPRAAEILWALTGPEFHRLLVTGRGWTPQELRKWLDELVPSQILKGPAAAKHSVQPVGKATHANPQKSSKTRT